jgi:hypothetical protein
VALLLGIKKRDDSKILVESLKTSLHVALK